MPFNMFKHAERGWLVRSLLSNVVVGIGRQIREQHEAAAAVALMNKWDSSKAYLLSRFYPGRYVEPNEKTFDVTTATQCQLLLF